MEQTDCSETLAYKFQTLGNHPKENIQHSVHGEGLKSRLSSYWLDESGCRANWAIDLGLCVDL